MIEPGEREQDHVALIGEALESVSLQEQVVLCLLRHELQYEENEGLPVISLAIATDRLSKERELEEVLKSLRAAGVVDMTFVQPGREILPGSREETRAIRRINADRNARWSQVYYRLTPTGQAMARAILG
jgi:hypothetical protein